MQRLKSLWSKKQRLAIGLMSGTSVDGVDSALVSIKNHGTNTEISLIAFASLPYPAGLKEHILEQSTAGNGSVDAICRLNVLLGEVFAAAVLKLLQSSGYTASEIDFIGSHGQTIHHLPEKTEQFGYPVRATLQVGEPAVIAKRTGILTVADFRPADLALGGQGAPLVPYFDYLVFRSETQNRALLNIGGIANFTVLPRKCGTDDVIAFDTGPGNMVIDWLMQELFDKPFDGDGAVARTGSVSQSLLASALAHPYFEQPVPKSTGREAFGAQFSREFLHKARAMGLSDADIIATATQLTVETVWQSYSRAIAKRVPIDEWIVSGGGTQNPVLLAGLRQKLQPAAVRPTDDLGIPADAKEAICFAVLANETLMGAPNNLPAATGAAEPTVLGKICL